MEQPTCVGSPTAGLSIGVGCCVDQLLGCGETAEASAGGGAVAVRYSWAHHTQHWLLNQALGEGLGFWGLTLISLPGES